MSQQLTPEASLRARVDERLEQLRSDLIAFRRDLHRHPELSGKEERTARVVAERLRRLDLDVLTDVGGHGVVALLRGGKPGPVVAFRADIDAVSSEFADPVDFPSTVDGVRHICGHDIHTTVGIALAEGFASIRNELAGSVLLIFQPAEETALGARAMIQAGALRNPQPKAIFALHTAPFEVGQIGSMPGVMLAGRDHLSLTLTGQTDLSGLAQMVRNVIHGVNSVDSDAASVSGDFIMAQVYRSEAGPEKNSWVLQALITTTSARMRAKAKNEIGTALDSLEAQGISYALDYKEREISGVTNDCVLEQASHTPIRSVVSDSGLVILDGIPPLFSEDFGFFQDEVPGVMYYLGVSNSARGWIGMPHTPQYVADEESIFVGARVMFAVMLDYLVTHPQ